MVMTISCGYIKIQGLMSSAITRKRDMRVPVLEKYVFIPNEAFLTVEESVRVNIQIILENSLVPKVKSVEIVDKFTSSSNNPLSPIILAVLEDQPMIQPSITILSKRPIEGVNVTTVDKELNTETDCMLIVTSKLSQRPELLVVIFESLKESGFIISREEPSYDISAATFEKLDVCTIHRTKEELLVLYRRKLPLKPMSVMKIESHESFSWIQELQKLLKSKSKEDVVIYSEKDSISGILGLTNCLRREPETRNIRCVFLMDESDTFDIKDVDLQKELNKNLAINVRKGGKWGTYRHMLIKRERYVETEHAMANEIVRGDLSSLRWLEGPLSSGTLLSLERDLVYDVMLASGKLSVDIVKSRIDQDCVLGLEYSGIDYRGNRVMGFVTAGAISSMILSDPYLQWKVPAYLSLEEAATVPTVYGTLTYGLLYKGKLKRGDSILIHSGTGGIGLAAIRMAIHYGATVYVTVGTKEKKEYLLKAFPQIKASNIGNSRDTSFEQMIMKQTEGRGVDLVLNSLAEDKLIASVRCLANGGRFIEIGKFDLTRNSELSLMLLEKDASFIAVALDSIMWSTPTEKRKIVALLDQLLKDKVIKPLERTLFKMNEVEQAFSSNIIRTISVDAGIRIIHKSEDDYYKVIHFSKQENILHHTFPPPSKRNIHAVITWISPSSTEHDVKGGLEQKDLKKLSIDRTVPRLSEIWTHLVVLPCFTKLLEICPQHICALKEEGRKSADCGGDHPADNPTYRFPDSNYPCYRYNCCGDKCYIILGGLGGFGLELADWMVIRGCRKLVLTSRKGVTTGYQAYRMKIWKSYGVNIHVSTANVATKEGCRELIKEAQKLGPIEGIYNLAVILQDAIFENQTVETFSTSFGPKATATRYLDEATREMCPDLKDFVIFSSVSCGRGNAGQTNYGMANSIMERICEKRRKDGYPGLAIEWGAVGEVGLVAEMQTEQHEIEIGGTLQQRISSCMDTLNIFLRQDEAPVVSSTVVAEKRGVGDAASVVDVVLFILGVEDQKSVSLHSTLPELGMDSMTSVEIKQTLEREFEIFLSSKDIRSLTLARLKEIEMERYETDSSNKSSAIATSQETTLGLDQVLRILGDVDESRRNVLRLESRLKEGQPGPTVFFLPGTEGFAKVMDNLASWLDAHVITKYLKKAEPFKIVAYSFGTVVGVELCRILESLGYRGNLICLDGTPLIIKNFIQGLISSTSEEEFQTGLCLYMLNFVLPSHLVKEHQEKFEKCHSWDEKSTVLVNLSKDVVKFDPQYLKNYANMVLKRLKAVMKYSSSKTKLRSQVQLFSASRGIKTAVQGETIPEDSGLSEYCERPVTVDIFEGSHLEIVDDQKIAEKINLIVTQ
nr:unnamed protein product [Callosobruchus analis]